MPSSARTRRVSRSSCGLVRAPSRSVRAAITVHPAMIISANDDSSLFPSARREGRIGGRRPKLTPQQQAEIRRMVSRGNKTAADAARLFRIHPATVCRLLARPAGPPPRRANLPNNVDNLLPDSCSKSFLDRASESLGIPLQNAVSPPARTPRARTVAVAARIRYILESRLILASLRVVLGRNPFQGIGDWPDRTASRGSPVLLR